MNSNNTTKILVVSDLADDAKLVKSLLSKEFDHVATATDPSRSVTDFDQFQPDILILAFNRLEKSEQYYLSLFRLSKTLPQHQYRTLVLCNKEEVNRVAELCMKDVFDDYILFWPMTFDAPRLIISVHNEIRELASVRASEPPKEDFATQIRHLSESKAGEQNVDPAPAPKPAAPEVPKKVHRDPNKPISVLVVDDDSFQRNLINTLLKSANFHVTYASGGEEALKILRLQQPDVVLMDVMMPDIDGVETTRRLKAMPQHAKTPVIMVTGDSEGSVVVDSLKAGASNFVVKPFNSATLISKIHQALGITPSSKK